MMKSYKSWIAVCFASVLFTVGAVARDWVVDTAHPSATDDNAGTWEAPLKTIGAGATSNNAFRPGGVL